MASGDARISLGDRNKDVWPVDCLQLPTDSLARQNPFPQDSRIRFVEDTHLYYIDGVESPLSVTGFIQAPFEHFDAKAKCCELAERNDGKYAGMTPRQIARGWIENANMASQLGTTMHAAVEIALNTGYWSLDPRIQPEMAMAKQFVQNEIVAKGLVPFRTEPIVFIDPQREPMGRMLPGSVDCVCRNPATGEYTVFDWKRAKDLVKTNNGRFGFGTAGPFVQDEAISFSKYSVQLHVYRYILQTYYGLVIPKENLYMVVFHPQNNNYVMFRAKDMSERIPWLLEHYDWCVEQYLANKRTDAEYAAWANEIDASDVSEAVKCQRTSFSFDLF